MVRAERKILIVTKLFMNLRISTKLMVLMSLLAVIAVGAGGFAVRGLMHTDASYSALLGREIEAATNASQLNTRVVDLARGVWRSLAIPTAEETATAIRTVETIQADSVAMLADVRDAVAGTPLAADMATLERDFASLQSVALRSLRAVQANRADEARAILQAEFATPIVALRAVTRRLSDGLLASAKKGSDELSAQTGMLVRNTLIILGAGVTLSLALGMWLSQMAVVRPIVRLDGTMQKLAGGDLATIIGDTERRDEIGGMARALEGFGAGLREAHAVRAQQETDRARAEHDRKAALMTMAGNLEQSVGGVVDGIASAATELNASATSMVAIAESTTGRAGTVSHASAEASGNVNTVAAATEELTASVAEIGRQVSNSARLATASVEQAQRTNQTVTNLIEAATRIGEVTRLIGDIAGQTNLLALNATIEAARAGEAGKGFAVVASEVKALATQTAQATSSIATQIQAMQAATRDAAGDIGAIRDSIGQISEVTSAIAAAVEQQGAATRDIALNVQMAASGTSEIAGAIDGVTAAAGETSGAATQVQSTSAILAEQAEVLRHEVGDFLRRVRAA